MHVPRKGVMLAGSQRFRRKTRRLSNHVVTREEPGPRDGKKETVTRTGTGMTTMGISTRTNTTTKTGMGIGTSTVRRVEERKGPGIH